MQTEVELRTQTTVKGLRTVITVFGQPVKSCPFFLLAELG